MLVNLSKSPSLAAQYLHELRDKQIQCDRLRFRQNLYRMSTILAYEVSKYLTYTPAVSETPLGSHHTEIPDSSIVVGSILRAGLPMHLGVLDMFDHADNVFVSAYRQYHKSGQFEIKLDYAAAPALDDKTLLLCDPMLATGASMVATLDQLKVFGQPNQVFVMAILASQEAILTLQNYDPSIHIFVGDIDPSLTAKGYIVPGLGDAGDLAFGEKLDIVI